MMKSIILPALFVLAGCCQVLGQAKMSVADKVNVFFGSSGDHGQLSPGASSPFGMLSIGRKLIRIFIPVMNTRQNKYLALHIQE